MTTVTHSFDDAPGYEQFMGRWSRPLGDAFLRWLSPAANMQWLDIGCGTGSTTLAIQQRLGAKAHCVGVDPACVREPPACRARRRGSSLGRVAERRREPVTSTAKLFASRLRAGGCAQQREADGEPR